jgi:hypothetical protein
MDIAGVRFGRLTAVRFERRDRVHRKSLWRCRCDCGAEVVRRLSVLRRGRTRTCGSLGCRFGGISLEDFPEYGSWSKMHERCFSENHEKHRHYGGRGITVCGAWTDDFFQFLSDMGPKPGPEYSIERKDVNGNYEPSNCKWATAKEQARNTRRSVFVDYQGERILLIELCERLGVDRSAVYGRLKNGWDIDRALSVPVKRYKQSS